MTASLPQSISGDKMFSFLYFLFGRVSFKAENGFAERFINLCTAQGIPLWNIHRCNGCIFADTTIKGYFRIKKPAEVSGMKVRILKKTGLPFIINRNKNKKGIFIGLIIFAVGLAFLSGRVWTVNVAENADFNSEKILQLFEDAGLKTGSRISTLETQKIISDVLTQADNISWATINFRGCTAEIEVRKAVEKPEIEKEGSLSNIIASKDGQIEILEAYRGRAMKKAGKTVLKGDLLISGVSESVNYANSYSNADGYVVAQTKINVKSQTDFCEKNYTPETKKLYSFFILGKEFGLKNKKEFDICHLHKSRAKISDTVLPFGINYRRYTRLTENENAPNYTKLEALNDYALKSYNETLHTQIISKNVSMEETPNGYIITGEYQCYENICSQQNFTLEELPEQ